jgi:hypothetical protein
LTASATLGVWLVGLPHEKLVKYMKKLVNRTACYLVLDYEFNGIRSLE